MIVNVALDSKPLKKHLHNSYDYSGLQFYHLQSVLLKELPINTTNKKSVLINIPKNLMWNTGEPVTGEQFKKGIDNIFGSNPILKAFYKPNIESLSCDESSILIDFKNISVGLDFLKLSNLSPLPKRASQKSSGPYIQVSECLFEPNSCNKFFQETTALATHFIKTPEENEKFFFDKKIDITADTAFRFEKYEHYLSLTEAVLKKDTGLFFYIKFSGQLSHKNSKDLRATLISIISSIDFSDVLQPFYSPIKTSSPLYKKEEGLKKNQLLDSPLTFVYHDFYPNKIVTQKITETLCGHGIACSLLEDSYENPLIKKYDLRLEITRGFSGTITSVIPQLAFSETAQQDSSIKKNLINSFFDEASEFSRITETTCFCPLFSIPSLSLIRKLEHNPLTRALSNESVFQKVRI